MDVRTRSGKKQWHCSRCGKWRALTKEWWYASRTTGDFMPPCRPCRLEMGVAWRASRRADGAGRDLCFRNAAIGSTC
jgi:hypothetical protein